jgi:glycosyltransferase involved in cell wall biosynthesis
VSVASSDVARRNEPSIAVVIPILNEKGRLLTRTLEALTLQTRLADRVIVVDDGSADPVSLPERLASGVELVRLAHNVGGAGARNRGARMVEADYVLFLNCDVVLAPEWLERSIAFMEANPDVGAAGGTIVPVVGKEILRDWRLHFIETKVHRTRMTVPTSVTWLVGHAILVRRSVYDQLGGFDEKYRCAGEDWDFCQRVIANGSIVSHVPELTAESVEVASVDRLARKSIRNSGWDIRAQGAERPCAAVRPVRVPGAMLSIVRLLVKRSARNTLRGRFRLIPIDAAVAGRSLVLILRHTRETRSRNRLIGIPGAQPPGD